jgi:hypothetical protein
VALGAPALASASGIASYERRPFAAPSTGDATSIFTLLPPERTGLNVENPYDDPTMWGRRYREYMGGGMGSGVAVGDYDGDGLPDVFVSAKTKPGRLFRNLGNWRFQDVTATAGVEEPSGWLDRLKGAVSSDKNVVWRQGPVFVDVNNDGLLDLYVCRNNAPNLVYVNRGDGTFAEEGAARGLAVVDGSVVGVFGDYDRDGWLDLFLPTNQVDGTEHGGRPDRLFRNTGNGYFTEVTQAAGLADPTFSHGALWLDYDGDGWPDLYVGNDFAGPDHLYRNNRDGTFTHVLDSVVPHTPYSSMGLDVADVDNDGYFDVFVADMATTTREKDRRGLVASRDDVLNMGTRERIAPQYMRNTLLLGTGFGVFREGACLAGIDATDWTWSVRFEDFDNDGWQDLHVTNGMVREANNADILSRMMGALSDRERIAVMRNSPPLAESNLAYRNLGDLRFEPVTEKWGLTDVGVSFGAATGDLDADGDIDLVYLDHDGGLKVFRNDTAENRSLQIRLRGTRSNRFGIGAIVRIESETVGPQARTMTISRGYSGGSECVAHFGLGKDAMATRVVVEWPSGVVQELRDLAPGHSYLIQEVDTAQPTIAPPVQPTFRATGAARGLALDDASLIAIPDREQAFLPFRTDRRGPALAVGDIDGDGRDDIYVGATTGSPARLLRFDAGRWSEQRPPGTTASNLEDGPALWFDADGDGTIDLLVTRASATTTVGTRPGAYQPVLHLNDGRGGLVPTDRIPTGGIHVGAAVAADIDGDGDLDLFLGARSIPGRYPEAPRSMLLRNDGGRFVDVVDASPGLAEAGLVTSALFVDVDRDGLPDLVLALEWDHVRVFRNLGAGRFADHTAQSGFQSGGRGWWTSLAAGDFNGDGRPDIVAGNVGLNTTYMAEAGRPAVLLHGDFAGNGTRMLVEAAYDVDGALYTLRARSDIAARVPAVSRKFPRNDAFARADIVAVFGEKPVTEARRYEADNFASGVFLSQADGTYRFEALPRDAQIAPIQGIVAIDSDGDGHLDIVATQNTDSAIPRFHGGLGVVLAGRGDGGFEARRPEASGVLLTGNGRALVPIPGGDDGRPGLFATRHGGTSELFEPQDDDVTWLEIRLRDGSAPGNRAGVGARVELLRSDGRTTHHEIALGGGWLSQSAPVVHASFRSGSRVVEANVRWPDGRTSRHTNVPERGRWILSR